MKAFVSFSINDQDHYILSLLVRQLRAQGFSLSQSNDFRLPVSQVTQLNLRNAELFIGLITEDGRDKDRVQAEWGMVHNLGKSSLILVEETVPIDPQFRSRCIFFNRYQPEAAIRQLSSKVEGLKSSLFEPKKMNGNGWAWMAAGAAAIGLLGHLASKK